MIKGNGSTWAIREAGAYGVAGADRAVWKPGAAVWDAAADAVVSAVV